jgi:hypothetical protein
MALFDVQVGSVEDVQRITLSGGTYIISNPEVTLDVALAESINRIFGSKIHQSIAASVVRRKN